jgi:putative DNA primase/helicase
MGSTLTGITSDEKLFFVHGPTNAGKSTFAEAMKGALGDYAVTTDFETFLRKRDGGTRNDIARLAGARMVVSLEVDEGKHLAVALIKSLTGGDTVTTRFLYREFFEFLPAFKLWLFANHRPDASAEDSALWRRILVIPFTRSLSEAERDESVKRILREDRGVRAAILAWAVRGCLEWQEKGLAPPVAILQASGDYREECDSIGDFITECCVLESQARAWASDLYMAYKQWCEASGDRPMSQKAFGRRLTDRGVTRRRGSGGRFCREGIRVSEPCERSEPDGDVLSHARVCGEIPPEGSDRSHGSLDSEAEERAGILEFDAGLDRVEAESRAR